MPYFLESLIGAIVWAVANAVYIDLRRKGEQGFGRFVSFFAGMPATWIWLFTIREGQVPRVEAPPDDEDRLLREIRVDRELRGRWAPPRHELKVEPKVEPQSERMSDDESEEPPGS